MTWITPLVVNKFAGDIVAAVAFLFPFTFAPPDNEIMTLPPLTVAGCAASVRSLDKTRPEMTW